MDSSSINALDILIVEDDPINRILLEGLLEESTLSISQALAAESLSAAMTLFDTNRFDVVLLDLNLPDSQELGTLTKVIKKAPLTAVIVITGEYGEDLGLEAIAQGAQDYLVKSSFDHEMLSKSIHYAIERKRMEEAGKVAFQELEDAHSELKEMQSQIVQSEKLASIGQLAAGVAHEINTPVGFVSSNFETLGTYMGKIRLLLDKHGELIRQLESSKDAQLQETVQELTQLRQTLKIDFILDDLQDLFTESQEGLERVTSIVQNLRDFSRIDQAEDMGDYSLNAGIQATLAVARNEIKYDAEIVTELGDIPAVQCSAGQINQVFLNILVNAAQAIKSQAREALGCITIKTYCADEEVVCEIADNGPGIPADKLTRIFDPFFTTKAPGEGTGLGLNVSYDIIVNKHQGQLLADSTVGQGTRFTIKLPVKCPASSLSDETADADHRVRTSEMSDVLSEIGSELG